MIYLQLYGSSISEKNASNRIDDFNSDRWFARKTWEISALIKIVKGKIFPSFKHVNFSIGRYS